MNILQSKLNLILDGGLGSSGKGLLAEYLGLTNHVDIAITSAASNAGHSFIYHGKKNISKYIPVSGIINKRSTIYLCSGAIINPNIFIKEVEHFDIAPDRIIIHPNCAVIDDDDILNEKDKDSATTKLSSTQSGVGRALSRKILRESELAGSNPILKRFTQDFDLQYLLDQGCTALMEIPQGMDLSLNGPFYPYCTSRDISVSSALNDAQVHPFYLGKVCCVIRTFPIRVGNIKDENGNEIGYSGPFYDDAEELSWKDIGVDPEITTVTGRERRVFEFSMKQYRKMIKSFRPDYVLLNFGNYLELDRLDDLVKRLPKVTHIGLGPEVSDIITIKEFKNAVKYSRIK
jgi:adenylosuccinate synthase